MDYNVQFWKSKAVSKNRDNKELKKRINEIKQEENHGSQSIK
jgi:hypothetical protein